MKRNACFFLATAFATVFTACTKKETSVSESADASLTGTWELYRQFGGMMPPATYQPGNGNLLSFGDSTYQRIRGGQTVQAGTYHLVRDSFVDVSSCALLPPRSAATNWIVADRTDGLKSYYEISGNFLTLTTGCMAADGGGSLYKKRADR